MSTPTQALLLSTPLLPLVLAGALAVTPWRPWVLRLMPWAALPGLMLAVIGQSGQNVALPWALLGIELELDSTGRVFLFVSATLWLLAAFYARPTQTDAPGAIAFSLCYLLAMSGNLALPLMNNMPSFYLSFAVMSFATYGLIVQRRDAFARRAGRVYIYLVVLGELALFSAIVLAAAEAESLRLPQFLGAVPNDLVIGLILFGFGIKAAVLPFHIYLPPAYMATPTPAAVVLAGAMINAGLLGWIRFVPLGATALPEWGALCVGAGLAAAFYGVLVGVTQNDAKSTLAYSSISQMGLITVAFGGALFSAKLASQGLSSVLLYALHHGLAKGALFFGVGAAAYGARTKVQRTLIAIGLLIPALALAGLPLTSGALAKTTLKETVTQLPGVWYDWIKPLLSLAAVGTTLLMTRFVVLAWPAADVTRSPPTAVWGPWALLLGLVLSVPWLWPTTTATTVAKALSPAALWDATWPVIVGGGVAWGAWRLYRITPRIKPSIPPGDVLVVFAWIARQTTRGWQHLTPSVHSARDRLEALPRRAILYALSERHKPVQLERWLRNWHNAGMMLLVVMTGLALLLMA